MANFNEDFKDVVDVSDNEVLCFGQSNDINAETIKKFGGYSRDSYLCYIRFTSKVNKVNNRFFLAYQVKANSSRFRAKEANQSKWFLVFKDKEGGDGNLEILDRAYARLVFDFDVDKFFQTDYFKKCIKLFKETVSKGFEKAKEMVTKDSKLKADVGICVNAIEKGINDLDKDPVFEDGRRTYSKKEEDPNKKYANSGFNMDRFEQFLRKQDAKDIEKNARRNFAKRK